MTALIGVDWGTTNLRAFRFEADGTVVQQRSSDRGAATLASDEFAPVLAQTIGDWTDGMVPILLAGMVGARAGWREAPYLPCPADPAALAAATIDVPTPVGPARIVPGLSSRGDAGASAMRGEETQITGAGVADGTVILPGTHSKWATLADGRVTAIATAMTGELYALLRTRSILGQLAVAHAPFDPAAFARGVERALAAGTIVPLLFSARADVLLGDMAGAAVESYLSGLLIGGEIAAFGARPVTLIGAPALIDRYRAAFALAGVDEVAIIDGAAAAARGLWKIGTAG